MLILQFDMKTSVGLFITDLHYIIMTAVSVIFHSELYSAKIYSKSFGTHSDDSYSIFIAQKYGRLGLF